MTDFYDRMSVTAAAQIADKGRDVKLVSTGADVWNPATGTFTAGTPTEKTVKAVFVSFRLSDIDGELIRTDDKLCLIAASSLSAQPTTSDKIKEGSTEWAVVSVNTIQPADIALLYKIQVRR